MPGAGDEVGDLDGLGALVHDLVSVEQSARGNSQNGTWLGKPGGNSWSFRVGLRGSIVTKGSNQRKWSGRSYVASQLEVIVNEEEKSKMGII